ncbi:MAG: LLM class flavin-dependent oxidoreductase [Gammaproteobacteria bacterium]|nr:LLM class flavin-dependent oxidoreductase [Gammaproteobacteria bacterium]
MSHRPHSSMFNRNRFKLGLFSPNCSGGMAATTVPERWDASWDNNLALARMAEAGGIEFLLPIARWTGYGGETDFQGQSLETITWCAGLLAATTRISVFATAHTAFTHPLVAAKQFATIDAIGGGRFGLNIVCGWNQPEYDMFGLDLPEEHDARYRYGQCWWDLIRRAWDADEPFDWQDEFFTVRHAVCSPKPYGRTLPPLMNAGSSEQGRDFAARNCDALFTVMVDLASGAETVRQWQAIAAERYQRALEVFTTTYVVCRPTRREAEDYHHYYAVERADLAAADRLMTLMGMHAHSFPREQIEALRTNFAAGHGVYPLVGDPDDVAAGLAAIADAGFGGATVAFVNYLDELPYFLAEVVPRLEARGLRLPAGAA